MQDNKQQEPGSRSLWDRIAKLGSIREIHDSPATLKPGDMSNVSEMAGWSAKGGHDAMDGVDRMALGETDATRELEAESATEGGPLELADGESCYDDRNGTGVMTTALEEDNFDWCSNL